MCGIREVLLYPFCGDREGVPEAVELRLMSTQESPTEQVSSHSKGQRSPKGCGEQTRRGQVTPGNRLCPNC